MARVVLERLDKVHPNGVRALADVSLEIADGELVVLFVVDPALWERAGIVRTAWLAATLRALDDDLGGRLTLRVGDPV